MTSLLLLFANLRKEIIQEFIMLYTSGNLQWNSVELAEEWWPSETIMCLASIVTHIKREKV